MGGVRNALPGDVMGPVTVGVATTPCALAAKKNAASAASIPTDRTRAPPGCHSLHRFAMDVLPEGRP